VQQTKYGNFTKIVLNDKDISRLQDFLKASKRNKVIVNIKKSKNKETRYAEIDTYGYDNVPPISYDMYDDSDEMPF
jgi:hypothetical protein